MQPSRLTRLPFLILALPVLAIPACRSTADDPAWTPLQPSALEGEQARQLQTALAARDALVAELVGTLTAEVAEHGPAHAISVCRDAAPRIAAETGARLGVRIGRTSHRLRNPDNVAPAWAAELLAEQPDGPRVAEAPDGRLGVTSPIQLAGACLPCHGPAESIAPDVREALARLYPDDRATGFQAGDLRGWFWVEVPAPAP